MCSLQVHLINWGLRDYGIEPSAWADGQVCCLGLEKDPEGFVRHIVEVFQEVKRVMRSDGVIWVNMGDSYWGGKGQSGQQTQEYQDKRFNTSASINRVQIGGPGLTMPKDGKHPIIKPLDKVNIPHRVAEALRADGWYWRSTVIWQKPNPMPESIAGWRWERCRIKTRNKGRATEKQKVHTGQQDHDANGNFKQDAQWQACPGCHKCSSTGGYILRKGSWRPTTSHEFIFMMTKTNCYFADGEAVKEELNESSIKRISQKTFDQQSGGVKDYGATGINPNRSARNALENLKENPSGRNPRSVWTIPSSPSNWEFCSGCDTLYAGKDRAKIIKVKDPGSGETVRFCSKYFRWDSWVSHFAAYPQALVEPCLRASTSEAGCCEKCGAAWARVVSQASGGSIGKSWHDHSADMQRGNMKVENSKGYRPSDTFGFRPTCTCSDSKSISMRVLDPFCGSGTTGIVAKRLGLDFVGIEIKSEYANVSRARISKTNAPDAQIALVL